jgi:hypothetical protein
MTHAHNVREVIWHLNDTAAVCATPLSTAGHVMLRVLNETNATPTTTSISGTHACACVHSSSKCI